MLVPGLVDNVGFRFLKTKKKTKKNLWNMISGSAEYNLILFLLMVHHQSNNPTRLPYLTGGGVRL